MYSKPVLASRTATEQPGSEGSRCDGNDEVWCGAGFGVMLEVKG
jgi:hypothetical protein